MRRDENINSNSPDLDEATPYSEIAASDRRRVADQLIAERASDLGRWSNPANFPKKWSQRARLAANLIAAPARVLDLGCGAMELEAELPAGCAYMPSDIVARDQRTLICDLNAGELPQADADVVVMLGVLEYIHAPKDILTAIAKRWPALIVSYNPSDRDIGRDRRAHGWFNDLRSAELVDAAARVNLSLQGILPFGDKERIYVFMSGAG